MIKEPIQFLVFLPYQPLAGRTSSKPLASHHDLNHPRVER